MFQTINSIRDTSARNATGQAAVELAVFGAVLIFILGTIVRTEIGNSYAQGQNFKAMRMALLNSWNTSKAGSMARNSSSVLFVEDRLSPDFNKYGDLDRNPFVANGAGTFSYELLYPLDPGEIASMLPIMDVYINGQYFPFTTASYVPPTEISRPVSCAGYAQDSCAWRQCERNMREWVGSSPTAGPPVNESQFDAIAPLTLNSGAEATATANALAIFTHLEDEGMIKNVNWSTNPPTAVVGTPTLSQGFISWYEGAYSNPDEGAQLSQIQMILQKNHTQYKLFYSQAVNGTGLFTVNPPTCSSHPCQDRELSSDLVMGGFSNSNGDMMYDLQRLGTYDATVNTSFVPAASAGHPSLRPYMAWQWSATAATTAEMIGLNTSNNQYPQYDVDGRLKVVTIYTLTQAANGDPIVSYEDFQHGDIDSTWDENSCGPKPGLQNDQQIFTFTKDGTYLQILEGGKLYNPVTNQYVQSTNKRNTIDLIQRQIQLSANTGRFCTTTSPPVPLNCVGNLRAGTGNPAGPNPACRNTPNPVEVCVDGTGCTGTVPSSPSCSCFSTEDNIKATCLDVAAGHNMLYVRSRLEDRRGRFWTTDTSGQLLVK